MQRRNKAQWAKVIEAFRSSGLTAAEFCKKHEFSIHTLKNQIYRKFAVKRVASKAKLKFKRTTDKQRHDLSL
ncbi:MAG: IS66 family insertion sequence element accessory protein TnpA [Oligoflexus sp.]